MFQTLEPVFNRFLRYDPGALRLVRGVDLMLTVVVSSVLANYLAGLQPGLSGFKMSVLAAAAGAHCLLFTPVSNRRVEVVNILWLGLILVLLFGFGALVGNLTGSSALVVTQIIWVCIIAIGFLLDGLGPFWERAGRMIAIGWLFVIMTSEPLVPGLWLPGMAVLGTLVACVIRIGLWRPSRQRTYRNVENAVRRAMADYLQDAVRDQFAADGGQQKALSQLVDLRKELRLCAELLQGDGDIQGVSPESATMMQLALEVVRGALTEMSSDAKNVLVEKSRFKEALLELAKGLRNGHDPHAGKPDMRWVALETQFSRNDQFHALRVAQAFERLWVLSEGTDPLAVPIAAPGEETKPEWWRRLSWRLGLQAGAAAAIAYGVGRYFDLDHAYWVTLTVIVILCSNLGSTMQKTVQRTTGTIIGVFVAMIASLAMSGYPEFGIGLSVLCIPLTIVFIDRNYAIAAGFISFMVVTGLHTLVGLPIHELWSRIYDTLIGGVVGLGSAWVLFPSRTDTSLTRLSKDYLTACQDYLTGSPSPPEENKRDYGELRRLGGRLIATAKAYRMERAPWSSFSGSSDGLDVLVLVLADYLGLYRQARASVLNRLEGLEQKPELELEVAKLNKRVLDEFLAVRKGQKGDPVPGLAAEWMAAFPAFEKDEPNLMADWVAMLYYARKVIRCLDGFRQDETWSGAFEPEERKV